MTTLNKTPLKWKEYQVIFADNREEAKDEAASIMPVVRSRGMWLNGSSEAESALDENTADSKAMTFKSFLTDAESLIARGAIEIGMNGGFDGANNVHEMNDGDCEPWITEWYVPVWTKAKGWLTKEEIESLVEKYKD